MSFIESLDTGIGPRANTIEGLADELHARRQSLQTAGVIPLACQTCVGCGQDQLWPLEGLLDDALDMQFGGVVPNIPVEQAYVVFDTEMRRLDAVEAGLCVGGIRRSIAGLEDTAAPWAERLRCGLNTPVKLGGAAYKILSSRYVALYREYRSAADPQRQQKLEALLGILEDQFPAELGVLGEEAARQRVYRDGILDRINEEDGPILDAIYRARRAVTR